MRPIPHGRRIALPPGEVGDVGACINNLQRLQYTIPCGINIRILQRIEYCRQILQRISLCGMRMNQPYQMVSRPTAVLGWLKGLEDLQRYLSSQCKVLQRTIAVQWKTMPV